MTNSRIFDRALDFIAETHKDTEYICEQMSKERETREWCYDNCHQHPNRDCVFKFIAEVYRKKE